MKSEEIRTLQFLEALDQEKAPTQRDLAKQFGISLGLVNAFLKRMIQKGYFKVTTIPKNRIKFALTPKGLYEKSRLTYSFVRYSLNYYKDARDKIKKLLNLYSKSSSKKFAIYGTGELAEITYLTLKELDFELVGVIDPQTKKKIFLGEKIVKLGELSDKNVDHILIATLDKNDKNIKKLAKNYDLILCNI